MTSHVQEIRNEYARRWPKSVQRLVTRATGKAATGETPPKRVLPHSAEVALSLAQFPASVLVGALGWRHPVVRCVAAPMSVLVSVNALRKLQVYIGHHAVHNEYPFGKNMTPVKTSIGVVSPPNYWIQ
ncbi:MAG: hypothetical protein ACRCYU_10810, partial [Nocardioides sp.]